jgi:hypothetical protein
VVEVTESVRVPFDELTMADDQRMTWHDQPFSGEAVETHAGGSPLSEATYRDGVLNGPSRAWYPSGQIKEEATYWEGNRHGPARLWDPQGRLTANRTYEFGILVAEQVWDDGRPTVDWRIEPDHNLYRLLELSRQRFGSSAPPAHDRPIGDAE